MASGSYSTDMSTMAPVWDISGNYQMVFDYSYNESCSMDFTITQSTSGLLGGSGSYSYGYDDYDEALYIDGELAIKGSAKTSGGTTRLQMNMNITGSGYIEVDYYNADLLFAESINFDFILDTNNNQLMTKGAKAKAKFLLVDFNKHINGQQVFWGTQIPLAASASSGWVLNLNLTPNSNKYTGTATALTQSGQSINYTVGGSYSTKADTSTLTLNGGSSGNLSLTVATSGSELTILSVKGKLLGQNLNYRKP